MSERTKRYLSLTRKYLREAEALLSKGDYVQACEKLWGAAAEAVKMVAAERGVELRSHRSLWEFVAELRVKTGDPELSRLFLQANYLHQNFYEGVLPAQAVRDGAEAVREFVNKLEQLV